MFASPNPRVKIRQSLMGYEVTANGIVVAGPYDTLARARQAKKRIKREFTRRDNSIGGFPNG